MEHEKQTELIIISARNNLYFIEAWLRFSNCHARKPEHPSTIARAMNNKNYRWEYCRMNNNKVQCTEEEREREKAIAAPENWLTIRQTENKRNDWKKPMNNTLSEIESRNEKDHWFEKAKPKTQFGSIYINSFWEWNFVIQLFSLLLYYYYPSSTVQNLRHKSRRKTVLGMGVFVKELNLNTLHSSTLLLDPIHVEMWLFDSRYY